MMSVVVLTPNLTGCDGISHLSRLIVRAYPDVTVVALHESKGLDRFEHAAVIAAGGNPARFAADAVRSAAVSAPGVTVIMIHVHLAPAALAFLARHAALVTFLCGIEAWVPFTWAQRTALQRSASVVAISSHSAKRFREANPRLAHVDVSVCHPGIPRTSPSPVAVSPSSPPIALLVGRMAGDERYKGHDVLFEIWQDVRARVPDAKLRIVGDGDDRPRLQAKAGELGLGESVMFAGRVPDGQLECEYANCTALVMPSREEGFGLVFVEAMRAGRPCVGLNGSASEIIVDGRTGLVVPTDRRHELTEAVVTLLGDPPRAARMGVAGRARFLERFTETRFHERLSRLIPVAVAGAANA